MCGIVSRAFILLKDARDRRFTCKICNTVVKSPQRKPNFALFLVKMVDICKKL